MKKIFYLLAMIVCFTSCKNVKKLVDQGKYDEAIMFSLKKMEGEENRKTKYVKALEDAFDKVNKNDLEQIAYWKESGQKSVWPKIYQRLSKIRDRQNRVEAYLPLISEDGYRAKFKFINVTGLLAEAKEESADYHYDRGVNFLLRSKEEGDKGMARNAHSEFLAIQRYYSEYKDVYDKSKESAYLGTTRVWLSAENEAYAYLPIGFNNEVLRFNELPRDRKWVEFYREPVSGMEMDLKVTMRMKFIDVSPEREDVRRHQDSKEIKHGFTYEFDDNGNVKKDSLGNDIKIPKYKTVTSETIILNREKMAIVEGEMDVVRMIDGRILDREPLKAEIAFQNYSINVRGDRRATCDDQLHNYNDQPLPFPHDLDMIGEAITQLKNVVIEKSIKDIN